MKPRTRQEAGEAYASRNAKAEQAGAESPPSMPYPVTLVQEDIDEGEGDWVATIDVLPGCSARGATPNEALGRAADAMEEWLETARREGKDIPEPKTAQSHSGRLLLRMPQTLHAELSRAAEREKVSLNQFITDALAGALGWRAPARKAQVTRAVPGLDGDETLEPGAAGGAGAEKQSRSTSTVFVVNAIVVAVAAVVAIVVLIAYLMR